MLFCRIGLTTTSGLDKIWYAIEKKEIRTIQWLDTYDDIRLAFFVLTQQCHIYDIEGTLAYQDVLKKYYGLKNYHFFSTNANILAFFNIKQKPFLHFYMKVILL